MPAERFASETEICFFCFCFLYFLYIFILYIFMASVVVSQKLWTALFLCDFAMGDVSGEEVAYLLGRAGRVSDALRTGKEAAMPGTPMIHGRIHGISGKPRSFAKSFLGLAHELGLNDMMSH